MSTVDYTLAFLADAESLVDQGGSLIAFAWLSSDGDPANGCVKFTLASGNGSPLSEKARRNSITLTWEDMGVPMGATVTHVEQVAGKRKVPVGTADTLTVLSRIINNSGTTVHSAGDLLNAGPPLSNVWADLTFLGQRAVDASYQASNTPVGVEIECTGSTQGTGAELRLDTFTYRITYTVPTPSSATLTPTGTGHSSPALTTVPSAPTDEFTLTLDIAAVSNETFNLSDGGAGGYFLDPDATNYPQPVTSITVAAGEQSNTFLYVPASVGTKVVTATSTGSVGTASAFVDVIEWPTGWHVRLYAPSLDDPTKWVQKQLPRVSRVSVTKLEMGGCTEGSFELIEAWELNNLTGLERLDLYYHGKLYWRGFATRPKRSVTAAEHKSPAFFGLAVRMDRWKGNRRYAYGAPTDIADVFEDILNDFVKIADRMPDLVIERPTSVGTKIQTFDTNGKGIATALNSLCAIAPGQCAWQGEPTPEGLDRARMFTRLSGTANIGQKPAVKGVGGPVGEVVQWGYDEDYESIINTVRILGDPVAQPNRLKNGSFEEPLPNSETIGNLLSDYSFESGGSGWTITGTVKSASGGDFGGPRTGDKWLEVDTNGEKGEKTVAIDYQVPLVVGCYGRRETAGTPRDLIITAEGLNAGSAVVTTFTQTVTPSDATYQRYILSSGGLSYISFAAYSTVTQLRFRVETNGGSAANDGVNVDDCFAYEYNGVSSSGWRATNFGAAKRTQEDWQTHTLPSVDTAPYHGGLCLKAQASGAGATVNDYRQYHQTEDARVQVRPSTPYHLTVAIRGETVGGGDALSYSFGVIPYKADGTALTTQESATFSGTASAAWGIVGFAFTTPADTALVEVFFRLRNNVIFYLDAFFLCEGNAPSEILAGAGGYWPGETYERTINVENADLANATKMGDVAGGTVISLEASQSLDTYGESKQDESVQGVTDYDSALAFAVYYLNNRAVAKLFGTLVRRDPLIPVPFDGKSVRLINLPIPPPALHPAAVHLELDQDGATETIELGREKPELMGLLGLLARKGELPRG